MYDVLRQTMVATSCCDIFKHSPDKIKHSPDKIKHSPDKIEIFFALLGHRTIKLDLQW